MIPANLVTGAADMENAHIFPRHQQPYNNNRSSHDFGAVDVESLAAGTARTWYHVVGITSSARARCYRTEGRREHAWLALGPIR